MKPKPKRNLAAIMFTDIVGYTAMMQTDEQKAVQHRAKHRKVFDAEHERFEGKIVQYYGDGTLSVFSSAVKASQCAIEIQRQMLMGEAVFLRIGLHLGDIVFDQTEVYGDAVNLASRIESMSVGGSVLLSPSMQAELRNKESIKTISLGSFRLKNVVAPIEVFAIDHKDLVVPNAADLSGKQAPPQKSIAVLPFVNMSPDPQNEYLSDGITEEIINALSKVQHLRVTSRTSSFYFKDKALPIKQIAQELRVSAILEGSVKIAGSELRITAQLIEAEEDYHFWSESWTRKMDNIFEMQDEISLLIADKLREQFGHFEIQDHLVQVQTSSIQAYESYLRGLYFLNKWNPEDTKKAIQCFEDAIALDPQHVRSYTGLAEGYSFLGTTGFLPYDKAWSKSHEFLHKAQELEKNLAEVHYQISNEAYFVEGDYQKAIQEMLAAVASKPNFAKAHQFLSFFYVMAGNEQASLEHIERAISLDPKSEETRFFRGYHHYMTGDLEQALNDMELCIRANAKNIPAHTIKAATLICLERYDEAIQHFEEMPPEVVIPEERYGITMLAYLLKEDEAEADRLYAQVLELVDGHNGIAASSYVFFRHALKGDLDLAFAWLEEALQQNSYVPSMRINDPLVTNLRKDVRHHLINERIFQFRQQVISTSQKKPLLDDSTAILAEQRLLTSLEADRSYLDPDLTLRRLAESIKLQPNQLSWLINERQNKNFNDLINQHRIEHFVSLAQDPQNAGYTILGLAYESGFNSKTTFNTSFKKEKGMTPRQFLKHHKA
ncbi:MAG: helix-turn-helix domain-containing protein [Saprospiraceae bacterium]|nr:helix-turn-helix domain-containing protein [Saprospiraceae bacterium]